MTTHDGVHVGDLMLTVVTSQEVLAVFSEGVWIPQWAAPWSAELRGAAEASHPGAAS